MDNIVDRDLLTEGSVWIRENSKQNTVLFTTNRTLPSKIQKNHPPQVVYVDEQGNVFNQSVTNFLKTRTFLNVNPTMEARCLALFLNMNEEDQPEDTLLIAEDDEGEGEESSNPEEGSVIARFMAGGQTEAAADIDDAVEVIATAATPAPVEFFALNDPSLPVTISSQDLEQALASYEVAPNLERGEMVHTLSFRCESNEVANNIFRAFHAGNHAQNLLYGFRVSSPAQHAPVEEVRWTSSLGVYPYIVDGDNFVRVMVLTPSPVPVTLPEAEEASDYAEASQEVGDGTQSQAEVPEDLLERVAAVIEAEAAETPQTQAQAQPQ